MGSGVFDLNRVTTNELFCSVRRSTDVTDLARCEQLSDLRLFHISPFGRWFDVVGFAAVKHFLPIDETIF